MKMELRGAVAAAVLAVALGAASFAPPAIAAEGALVVAQAQPGSAAEGSKARKRGASKKEMTVNQMAARERQKKCAAEWKEAKAAKTVAAGVKWPKFWSQCNARLKGSSA